VADVAPTGLTTTANREPQPRRIGLTSLCALALGLGIVTGLGAVVFRDLIGLIHNLMFLGLPVVRYDANLFTPPAPGEHSSSSCR
jgi:chloride channel protein, CIC family